MKQHYSAVLQYANKNSIIRIFSMVSIVMLFFTACQKNILDKPATDSMNMESRKTDADNFVMNSYPNLSFQTRWELQQARAATAKYQDINNAIADGYADIAVDVENMGHHYLKGSLVDGTFDIRHPEILVYNKDDAGNQQLVAVEYAIPLSNPKPEGFTGDADVWDGNTGFGLWLLHAWVWNKNPEGVFNPFNPLVHLH